MCNTNIIERTPIYISREIHFIGMASQKRLLRASIWISFDFSLHGTNGRAIFPFCFVADSIIGIRSNYNVNDQMVNPDMNVGNLPALASSALNVTANDGSMHAYVNQNQLPFDKNHENSPKKILESANVHAIDTQAGPSTLNAVPPTITVTPTDETDKTIDGMLDRISHDLDYLLNRMAEIPIPPAPPPPVSTAPTPLHPTNMSVHEVILEEEAEDL